MKQTRIIPMDALEKLRQIADKKVFSSGAESSGNAPRFDLIPRSLMKRLAQRFSLGASKYGEMAYRKGLADRAFIVDRINHMQQHLNAFLFPQNDEERTDDNLSAIAWACAFLCEVEAHPEGARIIAELRGR